MKSTNTYPLSPLQQGMLFHHISDNTSGVDIDQMVCYLNENLDLEKFQKSWESVIENHPGCRTSVCWEDVDEPVQKMNDNIKLPLETLDWSSLSKSEQDDNFKSFLEQDRIKGFKLNVPPLMRLTVIKLAEKKFCCIWSFHHILMDGRSHALIINDVFDGYDASIKGVEFKLKSTASYKDFIYWQRKQKHSDSELFWRKYLKGFNTPIKLNLRPPSEQKNKIKRVSPKQKEISIDDKTSAQMRALAEDNNITLNTIVQAAWGLLLNRYSGNDDILFGAIRAGRYATVEGSDSVVGLFMNTLPMRILVNPEMDTVKWLKKLREMQLEVRDREHTPLVEILGWSEIPRNTHLFDSVLIYDNYDLTPRMREKGGNWKNREFNLYEKTGYPLTVYIYADKSIKIKIAYTPELYNDEDIDRILVHFKTLLNGIVEHKKNRVADIPILTKEEKSKIFSEWNKTYADFPRDKCIHQLFEEQVLKTPDSTAVVCKGRQLSYDELNKRSNQIARKLQKLGIGPETLVGVYMHRSVEMMVALIGIHKAGGAYVPLDPEFPKDRITYMIGDSKCKIIILDKSLKAELNSSGAKTIVIDHDWKEISKFDSTNVQSNVSPDSLSYVIYTSGSTGKPKGVMVQHKNVINFFKGMDLNINYNPPGVWLAVTSLSFDISVLELFWTLSHGFKVVIYSEEDWRTDQIKVSSSKTSKKIDFSLFYFSSNEGENPDNKYRLLLEGAKFADQNRFTAVWTPERHFHDFGGLYPNPSVTGAGIATITNNVRIMSGSCVSPLHNPIRIAEEWSVVDNLSNGRIGISFAAGWQPNDFALMPQNYENRKEIMFDQIELVRKLWRGETVEFDGPNNKKVPIKILPRPVQKEVPIWITAANNPETFQMAGERGFNLLTHLLGQSIEDLEEKIEIYRKAWRENGHNPDGGQVSLMMHTFVGENLEEVREIVREPMKHYLKTAVSLVKLASWYFPIYDKASNGIDEAANNLSEEDVDAILNHAFERYFETSALLGTPETCLKTVEKLKRVGIDEVACLIDFGVDSEKIISHLQYLNAVKTLANLGVRENQSKDKNENFSIPELIKQHKVTHLQCTPSMAKMIVLENESKNSLKNLEYLMIGGEVFPVNLAQQLLQTMNGKILNMYGPTETTIWSSTYKLDGATESIPIGSPIANTEIYLLDKHRQLVPIGIPGELCIGGEGVVKGYFERQELTDEKFINNPFDSKNKSKKLYKTGDLACYRNDGTIEFLGRLDQQVKIRGYRIELGEIETTLEKYPLIREAIVIAREDIPGDKKLVAYLVKENGTDLAITDLRAMLMKSLPEYMIPSAFVFLQEMPLTPNGKVDKQALPAPEADRPDIGKEFAAPRTSTEKTLAELWGQVLGIDEIGVFDNFFELGGHSLSAVQVTVKIHQAFHIDLSLQKFFQSSNLEELANAVDEKLLELAGGDQLEQLLGEVENSE